MSVPLLQHTCREAAGSWAAKPCHAAAHCPALTGCAVAAATAAAGAKGEARHAPALSL